MRKTFYMSESNFLLKWIAIGLLHAYVRITLDYINKNQAIAVFLSFNAKVSGIFGPDALSDDFP